MANNIFSQPTEINSTLTIGSNNDLIITGSLGIGTTSPSQKLHVDGQALVTGTITTSNGSGGGVNYGSTSYKIEGGTYFGDLRYTAPRHRWYEGSNFVMTIDGGNVGIGTTNPAAKLDVYGTTNMGGFVTRSNAILTVGDVSGGTALYFDGNEIASDSSLNVFADDFIRFVTAGSSEIVRITSTGNVGIGTTTPDSKLSIKAGAGEEGIKIRNVNNQDTFHLGHLSSEDSYFQMKNNAGTTQVLLRTDNNYSYINTGNVGIGTTAPTEKLAVDGNIETTTSAGKIGFNVGDAYGDYPHYGLGKSASATPVNLAGYYGLTFGTQGSERMRILQGGWVGIGTTSPQSKLHVNTEDASSVISLTRGGTNLPTSTEISKINFDADYNSGAINYGYISAGSNNISGVRGSIEFGVKSTSGNVLPGMTLYGTNTGVNLGIGTTAPSSLLHLYKSSGTSSSSTGTTLLKLENYVGSDLSQQKTFIDFILRDGNTNETPQVRIGAEVGTNGDANTQEKEGSGAFVVYTNNAESISGDAGASLAERFRVDYQGNVGIGTTSPAYKLDVTGAAEFQDYVRITNSGGGQRIVFGNQDSAGVDNPSMLLGANGNTYIGSGNSWTGNGGTFSSVATFTNIGNVGIGTTTPGSLLEVNKDSTSGQIATYRNNTGYFLHRTYADYNNDGATVEFQQRIGVDGNYSRIGNYSNHPIYLMTNGSTNLTLLTNGNVGIGTTSPEAPLHVATASDYKVIKLGDDTVSHYKFTGQSDHTLTLTCGSYYMAEVVITAAQSNGGTYNNLYIRGIWSNNHTTHHWDVLEEVGFMGQNTVSITNDENNVSNSGKLEIVHDYVSGGSFLGMTVRVTDYSGTHSYTIS